MQRTPFYFYCDEAGHLGFADNQSAPEEAISLVAGLIADHTQNEKITLFCENLYSLYSPISKETKFHITDLKPEQQEELREKVFSFIRENEIKLAYAAIYFSSLRHNYQKISTEHEAAQASLKEQDINLSRLPSQLNKRAHSEAFYHFYCTAMCFAITIDSQPIEATVFIDRIDDVIATQLSQEIKRCHMSSPQYSLSIAKYHHEDKSREKNTISIESCSIVTASKTMTLNFQAKSNSSGKIIIVETKYSIVADIVTNSILHYLTKYAKQSNFGHLNCYEAIKQHPLSNQIIGLQSKSLDRIHAHPEAHSQP